uniref:Microtubule-associated protein 10 n=1 Tax=Nannospalax galili TaxID=1026970 RepID=A0A8C6RHR4_NANGA
MAATEEERLFSLELLVDWVRLEAGAFPHASNPAVAFHLLDFPPLFVLPPTAPRPAPHSGVIGFGRGKVCLLRLRPTALGVSRLRTALLLLSADPAHAPRLLGSCDVRVHAFRPRRGTFGLCGPAGERVGEVALFYRLTDLGHVLTGTADFQALEIPQPQLKEASESRPQGNSEPRLQETLGPRPQCNLESCLQESLGPCHQGKSEQRLMQTVKLGTHGSSKLCHKDVSKPRPWDVSEPLPQDTSKPRLPGASEPLPEVARVWSAGDSDPSAVQKHREEVSFHSKASSGDMGPVPFSPAPGGRSVSPGGQEAPELDFETNTICPPPLYYTHLAQEKMSPARVEVTFEPQRNGPDLLDGDFPETKLVSPPTHSVKHTKSATQESPPVLLNLPPTQDPEAANAAVSQSQTEQSTINTIRQLPLLNALLIELSLLYNQPVASSTHVHPQLAWLYRAEHKGPETSAKSTSRSESKKSKFSVGEHEKSTSLQSKKNQVENHRSKHLERISGSPPPRVTKGRLLYGLTNTLRLRLKQTNPDMLIVHEKREQYRKMQIKAVGPKVRVPSRKVLSLATPSQVPPQLPEENSSGSNGSFAEDTDTSGQINAVFDEPNTTKEMKPSHAIDKQTADWSETRNSISVETVVSPADSISSERFAYTDILRGKSEMKAQIWCVSRQEDAPVDRVVGEEIGRQVKTTSRDKSENRPSRNSSYESISELRYSDDFTSPCYSEDFCTSENSRSLPAQDSSARTGNPKHSSHASGSSEARLSTRKSSSGKSGVSPPFSACSPVCSHERSHVIKTQDRSLQEASSISTSDLSSSQWTDGKENQTDLTSTYKSKVVNRGQDIKLQTGTGCKSSKKSQSPRTFQVSSYLPSNLNELELKASGSSPSEEEDDDLGSLSISKQCKDIRELIINKLPGYTV